MKNEKQPTIVAINATVDEAKTVREGLAHKVNIVAKAVATHKQGAGDRRMPGNAFTFPQGPICINGQWHL